MMQGWLNFFVTTHLLLALAALLACAIRVAGRAPALSAASELRLHYCLLALFAILLVIPFGRDADVSLHPVAHVELATTRLASIASAPAVVVLPGSSQRSLPLELWGWIAAAFALLGSLVTLLEYVRLARELRSATVFRKLGRVRIAVSASARVPFSTRGLRHAWVVLPASFVSEPLQRRVAIAHELQHHRAGDTLWCHAFAPLRALCFFHPLRHAWCAAVEEAQELACDEVLVRQKKKISAGDYSRCLVDAAESAARSGVGRAYAAAPSLFCARRLLVRRIENMYGNKRNNRKLVVAIGALVAISLSAGAWAQGRWVVDSRVSRRKMVEMAEEARKGTEFPIVVNDDVLRVLNYYLGTAKGRAFTAMAEANLDRLRPLLEREVADHRVPDELLAVGFCESGFQNLLQSPHPAHSAGVWQFVPSTARKYGLRVDDQIDERLDVERETDAAFRYLGDNHGRFGDWLLSITAYNAGEKAVQEAIDKYGTRDAWQLLQHGKLGDPDYLARFMAGVLILKNRH